MAGIELGRIIAERSLQSDKLAHKVTVKIGCPQGTSSEDFVTPYQIVGVGDEKIRHAAGIDAVQSLQLAFQKLGAEIQFGLKEYGLRWLDGEDAGFPIP